MRWAIGLAAALALALIAGCGSGGAPAPGPRATATTTPSARASAGSRSRGVRLVRIGSFDQPLYVTAPPGDTRRVFVVEQGGRVRVVRGGRKLAQPFLDLRSQTSAGG